MKRLTASVATLLALAIATAAAAPSRSTGRVVDVGFRSVAINGNLRLAVYLPPGYDQGRLRYPVLYFLHGLPAGPTAYRGIDFLRRALERSGRGALIVAPQGARAGDTDPEYLDWGPGRRWETAVAREVPAFVDAHFRTIRDRPARAIVGLSAGGYGAVLVALHHLGSFSVVESWSGYFHPTDPQGTQALDLGSGTRNAHASAHTFVSSLRLDFAKRPTFFAFYVGRGDDRFRDENEQLHRELVAAGVPHVFHVYAGGHEQTVWSTHARTRVARARTRPPRAGALTPLRRPAEKRGDAQADRRLVRDGLRAHRRATPAAGHRPPLRRRAHPADCGRERHRSSPRHGRNRGDGRARNPGHRHS